MESEFSKNISRAKINMMRMKETMFLSTLCCSLEAVKDDSVFLAATNGKQLLINEENFMALTLDERIFLLAHETMHVAYKHMLRLNDRDPQVWNHAADYVINGELVQQGFKMIEGGLIDPQFDGMSADEVYAVLIKTTKLPENPLDGDIVKPSEGSSSSSEGDDDGDGSTVQTDTSAQQELEQEIDSMLISAAQICDMNGQAGAVPGSVRRYLDKLAKPKVNWKAVLRRFMHALDKSDYSWARPNKRYQDYYLPHMRGEAISQISFSIDTSGSVSQKDFNQFISEVSSVMKVLKPKTLHLMQFDHILQSSDIIKNLRELSQVEFKGHGGTNPSVALEEFIQSKSEALIMLTDGCFYTENLPKPRKPVLWVIFDNPHFEAPYGKVIHISMR